ncbi:hypothetical protein [Herbaspirillum seropedicae]|uniref:hypothetical protein n=1 Tax=Herbaspirillum seropedicae TaxID=964 RepID=UPI000847F250|nr:hypothetical protein [Herbaspirillum seropedicae]AON55134.1 hypothetical protein Hsc_2854 [Herbaspirillum seropedicae]
MTKEKSENYSADLAKFLEKSEGNSSMVYLDKNGNPTIGIGTLLYKKELVQEKAVDIVTKESSDPELFQKVMTAIVEAKGDEKELEKLFVMGKEGGNRTLLKLRQQDSKGEVVEADVSKLLPKSAALKVMEVASPQYEDRVKKIEKSLSHTGEEFSFSDRQRMAVFSRVYNGTPKDDFWPNLQSKDIGRIAEFFSDRRGGMGNTGHYSRTIDEIAMFTGRPLVKRNDAIGILGKDADGNDMFVGFRRLEKVRAGQDAAELVAFSIRENSDGTKTQHNVELRLPPRMNRATDFIDSQTVEYNAVLDSQRRKSQRDSVKMSDDAERGSVGNAVSANPRAPEDDNVSHRHSPSKTKLKH